MSNSPRYGTKESDLSLVAQMADSDVVRVLVGDVPARMSLTNFAAEVASINSASTKEVIVRTVSGNTALSDADNVLLVDCTSGNLAVSMPNPVTSFDATTNLSASFTVSQKIHNSNTLTINPFGSESFYDGAAQSSIILSSGASVSLVTDGTDWTIVSA